MYAYAPNPKTVATNKRAIFSLKGGVVYIIRKMSIRKYKFDYSVAYFDVDKDEFEYLTKQFIERTEEEEEEGTVYARTAYRITISPRISNLPPAEKWGNDKTEATHVWQKRIKNSLKEIFDKESMDIVYSNLYEVNEKAEKIEVEDFQDRIRQIHIKTRIETGKRRHSIHGHILVIIDHTTRVQLSHAGIQDSINPILNDGLGFQSDKKHYIHLKWLPNAGNFDGSLSGAERYLMKP